MKTLLTGLALTTALTAPSLASAAQVTLHTQLRNYGYNPADLAFYVTDSKGAYVGSVWMAGYRSQYYRHLMGWYRATRGNLSEIQGITGASVGSGRSLTVTFDLADSLIDAGYSLHVDVAAENYPESPNDVVVPLTKAGADSPVSGRGYIQQFSYSL